MIVCQKSEVTLTILSVEIQESQHRFFETFIDDGITDARYTNFNHFYFCVIASGVRRSIRYYFAFQPPKRVVQREEKSFHIAIEAIR